MLVPLTLVVANYFVFRQERRVLTRFPLPLHGFLSLYRSPFSASLSLSVSLSLSLSLYAAEVQRSNTEGKFKWWNLLTIVEE